MRVLLLLGLLGLQLPDRWDTVVSEAYRLRAEDKPAEAAAVLEKALASDPRGEGHFLLALVYEDLAFAAAAASPADNAGRRTRLTRAVEQFTRALDLVEHDMRFSILFKLVDLHRPSGLDQPTDATTFAARLVESFPTRAESYMLHGQVLHEQGRLAEAAETMRQGRARASEFPAIAEMEFVRYVIEYIEAGPNLPRPEVRAALDECLAAMDGVLAATSDTQSADYALATFARKMVLRTIAERVEEDPARKAALLAEADQSGPSSQGGGETVAFVDVPVGVSGVSAVEAIEQALLETEAKATADWEQGRLDAAVQVLALEVMYAAEHLVGVYAPDALAEPALALAAAREGIRRAPSHPRTHGLLLRALLDAKQETQLRAAFDTARGAIPPDEQVTLANEYLALVGTAARSRSANAHLVREADALIDAALARDADALFALATKEWALRERAAHVEQDAARAAALVEEADRVAARVKALRSRTP